MATGLPGAVLTAAGKGLGCRVLALQFCCKIHVPLHAVCDV